MLKDPKRLTPEEMEVALMLLLEKANLSVADKNTLRFGPSQLRAGEVDLRKRLERVLRPNAVEREDKKETPQKRD